MSALAAQAAAPPRLVGYLAAPSPICLPTSV